MKAHLYLILSLLLAVFSLTACGEAEEQAPQAAAEETAAREWIDAVMNGDGATLITRTCKAEREAVQNLGLIRSAVAVIGQELVGDEGGGSSEGLKISLLEESRTNHSVHVMVDGEIISSVLAAGLAQEVHENWLMVSEDGTWRWCGIINSNEVTNIGSLKLEWSTDIGDIRDIVVAEDGFVYGLVRANNDKSPRHVVFAPNGERQSVVDLPEADWQPDVMGLYDGNFFVMLRNRIPALIKTNHEMVLFDKTLDKPTISPYGDYIAHDSIRNVLTYYRIDPDHGPQETHQVEIPDNARPHDFKQDYFKSVIVYADQEANKILMYDQNGVLVYNDLPDEGLKVSVSEGRAHFPKTYITPWGDLWLSYDATDEIGANLGAKVVRIDSKGQVTFFDEFPFYSYSGIPDPSKQIKYLSNKDEVYLVGQETYAKLDKDFQILAEYTYPDDVNLNSHHVSIFTGFDGHMYILNRQILSKYIPTSPNP